MSRSLKAVLAITLTLCFCTSCSLAKVNYSDLSEPASGNFPENSRILVPVNEYSLPSDVDSTTPEDPISGDSAGASELNITSEVSDSLTDSDISNPTSGLPLSDTDESIEEDNDAVSPSVLNLCLLGDIMCLSGQQNAAKCEDGSHDYTGNYSLIQPIFEECDYVIGNLETCLAPSAPYAAQSKNVDGNPNCNAPVDLLDSLTAVGITHLVTANNHCLDAGTLGIEETLKALDNAGIIHTGTHTPEQAEHSEADYMLLRSGSICVAVISVTELINRRHIIPAEDMHLYVNEYSKSFISSKIAAAREEGASYVIVYEHWGSENTHEIRSYQSEHARNIAEAGADLIIGSHSHCVQPMEVIETSDGRVVPCYYSLGNVVSSMANDINHDTVLVRLSLSRQDSGPDSALNSQITNVLCHVIWNLDGVSFVIAPTDYDTGRSSYNDTLKIAEERITSVLEGIYE